VTRITRPERRSTRAVRVCGGSNRWWAAHSELARGRSAASGRSAAAKAGVGKSVVTSSLAAAMAGLGRRVRRDRRPTSAPPTCTRCSARRGRASRSRTSCRSRSTRSPRRWRRPRSRTSGS
jgi:hypothetical protein